MAEKRPKEKIFSFLRIFDFYFFFSSPSGQNTVFWPRAPLSNVWSREIFGFDRHHMDKKVVTPMYLRVIMRINVDFLRLLAENEEKFPFLKKLTFFFIRCQKTTIFQKIVILELKKIYNNIKK